MDYTKVFDCMDHKLENSQYFKNLSLFFTTLSKIEKEGTLSVLVRFLQRNRINIIYEEREREIY